MHERIDNEIRDRDNAVKELEAKMDSQNDDQVCLHSLATSRNVHRVANILFRDR